ncbi:hypothetical protein GE09DRAFT_1269946, partial [Coniochaeta sp. 2T2.1]
VSIVSAASSGNGCPQGTVSTTVNPDKTLITLGYDAVRPHLGPGATPGMKSQNCVVHLRLKYPTGWRFIIDKTRWHGIFSLTEDASATLYTLYEIVSSDTQVINVPQANVNGSRFEQVDGDVFDVEYPIQRDDEIASMCGREERSVSDGVGVHDRFALTAKKAGTEQDGFLVADTALFHQIGLRWEPCQR